MSSAAVLAHALEAADSGDGSETRSKLLGWALLCSVCFYMASFAIAWGGVPWIYPSEIFPMAVKERALSTSVCSQWVANFLVAFLIPQQVASLKVAGTFAFYAVCLGLCFLLVYLFVPETKGLPLEDMDRLFGKVDGDLAGALPPPIANHDRFSRQYSTGSSACSIHDLVMFGVGMRERSGTAPDV
eukprot:CAMPEP_0171134338 /NCGR_PEP_ID=MMETSP0766_2-20121228/127849_1 /TAXON_ID=439317 /ORGANISM="Gambierdiscus australes, Strain CAWD 149" /LENGTH=185 /DNA_ID=CAMNT_0011597775 /DNA_START=1 /DNA_END=554 /DNA_ORIENTATION=+